MAVTKEKKAEALKEITDKFSKAKAVYFSGYRGLNMKKMVALRKKLHQSGVDYAIAKKTLFRIAAKKNNMGDIPDEIMQGPVAAAISYDDVVIPAKLLYEFSKDAEQIELLGGLVDGKFINRAQAKELAMLPSRTELLTKLVGTLKAPISGFHGVLSGVLRKFVFALAAVRDKKTT
jgi:large subunit ribosomal protein L10